VKCLGGPNRQADIPPAGGVRRFATESTGMTTLRRKFIVTVGGITC
jgi:hypothetical protein